MHGGCGHRQQHVPSGRLRHPQRQRHAQAAGTRFQRARNHRQHRLGPRAAVDDRVLALVRGLARRAVWRGSARLPDTCTGASASRPVRAAARGRHHGDPGRRSRGFACGAAFAPHPDVFHVLPVAGGRTDRHPDLRHTDTQPEHAPVAGTRRRRAHNLSARQRRGRPGGWRGRGPYGAPRACGGGRHGGGRRFPGGYNRDGAGALGHPVLPFRGRLFLGAYKPLARPDRARRGAQGKHRQGVRLRVFGPGCRIGTGAVGVWIPA